MSDDAVVRDNEQQSRYEILIGDQVVGYAVYQRSDDARNFVHTVVEEEYQGRGLGEQLIGFALADCRANGLLVIATCSFVADYIARHKSEYGDLLAPGR